MSKVFEHSQDEKEKELEFTEKERDAEKQKAFEQSLGGTPNVQKSTYEMSNEELDELK